MIVLDSSAVLAVLFQEPEAPHLIDVIEAASSLTISVANALECAMRLAPRPGLDDGDKLDAFFALYQVRLAPVDLAQYRLAREAYLAFGKDRHPASLNFGDCFAYALAKAQAAPLLFVGEDFSQTDLPSALPKP